ncbi:MAG: GNAT family N-acetyltransferase [Rhodobacterales bacterium]|nr:GNAT family N-acetyltransferase [Rhodobacterales bacterium]
MIRVLETERLRLRGPRPADIPEVIAFWASDRSRHVGGPRNPQGAWEDYAVAFGSWLIDGFGYWAIESRDDHRFVGLVGFCHPPNFPEPEMGWALMGHAEGKGYATEAASAALGWCRTNLRLPSLVSYIEPANHRSIRLAARLGAWRDTDARAADEGDIVMRHMPGGAG